MWIKNDDAVAIRPLIDSRGLNKCGPNRLLISLAAMQGHHQPASLLLRTALRDKRPGSAIHINGRAIVAGTKLVLVELDEASSQAPGMPRIQLPIEHAQKCLFRIDAAVVDEGRCKHRASGERIRRYPGVLRTGEVVEGDVAVSGKALVILVKGIHGGLPDDRVEEPAEHVNRFAANVAGGINLAGAGFGVGKADQRSNGHALTGGADISP